MDPFVEIEIAADRPTRQAESLNLSYPTYKTDIIPCDIRQRFATMRQLARDGYTSYFNANTAFYNKDQRTKFSQLFHRQAVYMADFTDDYQKNVPFSAYYPFYQMMNAEQLRTYFTWRTRLRAGEVSQIGISYAYLYVYELLNQIGVKNPVQGLHMLLSFWKKYHEYSIGLDKHIVNWIKDYHVYYSLPGSFSAFINEHDLQKYFDESYDFSGTDPQWFELICEISHYDIKRSPFYNEKTQSLIQEAVCFAIRQLDVSLKNTERPLDGILFNPLFPGKSWEPFNHALFIPYLAIPDKKVILSASEIYLCRKNQWTCRTAKQCNRKLAGYILKQTESLLREAQRYKRKLSARLKELDDATLIAFQVAGIKPDIFLSETIQAFIAAKNRIEVTVQRDSLNKIRKESLAIQEKLIVEEMPKVTVTIPPPPPVAPIIIKQEPWDAFYQSLTETEKEVLTIALHNGDINAYAAAKKQMAEVIIDGINQKAMDTVSDAVMDFDKIYPDYLKHIEQCIRK